MTARSEEWSGHAPIPPSAKLLAVDVATDRPGVGKSMLVEAALEHFLNPAPSVEALMRERLDDMHDRFDDLARDMRMMR